MAFVAEIEAKLKADNSDFRSKMAEAGEATEKFDKQVKKFGLGFGGVAVLASTFRAIVDYARDLENPMDENLKRAKAFALGLDDAKKGMLELGAKALGVVNGLGEWMGRQVAILKYGKEQVQQGEAIEKQTQETLAAIEKDKKLTEDIGKVRAQIRETQKKTNEEAEKQLDLDTQIAHANHKLQAAKDELARGEGNRLEQAKAELAVVEARNNLTKLEGDLKKKNAEDEKKAGEEAEKLAEKREKLEFEILSKAEKRAILLESEEELTQIIWEKRRAGLDTTKEEIDFLEIKKELDKQDAETAEKLAKLKFEALTIDERIAKLTESELTLKENIESLQREGLATAEDEVDLLGVQAELEKLRKEKKEEQTKAMKEGLLTEEKLASLGKDDLQLQADLVEARIAKAKAEGLVTEEMEKQLALIHKIIAKKKQELDITIQIIGAGDEDVSDRSLEDKINTIQRDLEARRFRKWATPGGVGGMADYDPLIFEQEKQLAAAKAELEARQLARQRVSAYGEDGAARIFYQGHIAEYERLLKLVTDQPEAKKTTTLLESIDQRMKQSGLFPKL